MEPTLKSGDQIIIKRDIIGQAKVTYGDIVVFDATKINPDAIPESPLIKRVVAVEGDTLEIKDGSVYVNNKLLKEDYINGNYTLSVLPEFEKMTVPKGMVYVLGDNRLPNQSLDSRTIGPIPLDSVTGKMLFKFYGR